MTEIVGLMQKLGAYVTSTDSNYSVNYKAGVRTYPIPFFGNLERATVVTIGLNPSATEFEGRGWPPALDAQALADRLTHYFDRGEHAWFSGWTQALRLIGASYRENAAHIDISPRATISAAAVPNRVLFERMLEDDLPWMIRFLEVAPRVRLVLMAGTATKRYYLNEFLAKRLNAADAVLEGRLVRPEGSGKVLHHVLVTKRRRLPVYFCSSSPSDRRTPGLLLARLAKDAPLLREHLVETRAAGS